LGKKWEWGTGALDYNKSKEVASYYFNKKIPSMLREESIPDTLETRLAAYNWGIGHLSDSYKKYKDKWIKKAPSETKNYITKYKAAEIIRNWFKKLGQYAPITEYPKDIQYYDVGHSDYNPEYESLTQGKENYLWVYDPKSHRLYSVREDNTNVLHQQSSLKDILKHSSYFGRFDAQKKELSIAPYSDTLLYRPIPTEVLNALHREFKDIKQIYLFS
jgi:hypothetical protein